LAALATVLAGAGGACAQSFVNFESGHVRPLALAPDTHRLFAVNTPDNRVAVYDVTSSGLALATEVPVGLEPVAAATRTNALGRTEVWVVNHLSDSVSIVEVDPDDLSRSRVTRTLLVGDEPRDIVFAGSGAGRAFVTCAHRGQNRPGDPQLTTPGVPRADVWVFDAASPGGALGGTPIGGAPIALFADTPRALATNGAVVWAAAFHSGNQTTTVLEPVVSGTLGLPPPPPNSTPNAPGAGLIVKWNAVSGQFEDELGRGWNSQLEFRLPDHDVFLIDADAAVPALVTPPNVVDHVGTIIFNMAVNPVTGRLYVANTDARNQVRFEPLLQADLHRSRITVVTGTSALPVHLNGHINHAVSPGPPAEIEQSLAFPMDMVVSANGMTLYVAAFGSGKVAALDTAALEAGSVVGTQIEVGLGPSGLALDEGRSRLYAMNRIDHTISVVSTATQLETAIVPLRHTPEPAVVRNGRRFLYDARTTSGHGDQACASCHVFGDLDSLAWDLGDPTGTPLANPNPFRVPGGLDGPPFHPMKGPMATQSLRGLDAAGPMHWRGDRTGGTVGGDPLSEDLAFKAFNPAFVGLLGRGSELAPEEMQAFTDFILSVRYPPNPIRALDNSLDAHQSSGQTLLSARLTDLGAATCTFCHRLPLGTDGSSALQDEPQQFKIPHFRNLYQKIGMFGLPPAVAGSGRQPTGFLGDQVRGFGFQHDGAVPTILDFVSANRFESLSLADRGHLEAFLLTFDTGLRPAVGQQVSATPATFDHPDVVARIALHVARHEAGDCDLVVKGVLGGLARGGVYAGGGGFQLDRNVETPVDATALRLLAATSGQELTYTCVPPGSGVRIGVDRDEDTVFDRSELDAGTDPVNPHDAGGPTTSTLPPTVRVRVTSLELRDDVTDPINPNRRRLAFRVNTRRDPPANDVAVPARGAAGDPTAHGAVLRVFNSEGLTPDTFEATLPADGWRPIGSGATPKGYRFTSASGPIQRVTVKAHRIAVRGGSAAFPYTLDEPFQGSVAVRLRLGQDVTWCAESRPPYFPKPDHPGKFAARPNTPPPAACP
jgi:DNA-binding beta-propeller fold protein YncE